ncbi:MAG: DUF234 domain-containing protein [Pseudonocardiaceae bacterium]
MGARTCDPSTLGKLERLPRLAVEPQVRDAIARLLPDDRFGETAQIGGWWNRAHDTEIDLVGIPDPPDRGTLVGSVKWRDRSAFDDADARELAATASIVGFSGDPRHVGVSRAGLDLHRQPSVETCHLADSAVNPVGCTPP